MTYPDCAYLGSDAAELQAFAATLGLIKRLESEGHSRQCATLQAADSHGCICKLPAPPVRGDE